jgi:hypothetical protein
MEIHKIPMDFQLEVFPDASVSTTATSPFSLPHPPSHSARRLPFQPQPLLQVPLQSVPNANHRRNQVASQPRYGSPLPHPCLSRSTAKADPASGVAFHCLAPLPALRFGTHIPQTKAKTEAYLQGQAETMKRLRIRDMENSDEDWGVIEDDDSACEAEERNDVVVKKSFSTKLSLLSRRSRNQLHSPRKPLIINAAPRNPPPLTRSPRTYPQEAGTLETWTHVFRAPRERKSNTITLCFISSTSSLSLNVRRTKSVCSPTHQVPSIDVRVHQSHHQSLSCESIGIESLLSSHFLIQQATLQYPVDDLLVGHIPIEHQQSPLTSKLRFSSSTNDASRQQ